MKNQFFKAFFCKKNYEKPSMRQTEYAKFYSLRAVLFSFCFVAFSRFCSLDKEKEYNFFILLIC